MTTSSAGPRTTDPFVATGILLGIVLPVIAAILYPTYMHQVQPGWAEWTRLAELPFVACELALTHRATRRGYSDADAWSRAPRDVRWALALLLVGLTASSVLASKNPAGSIVVSIVTLIHLRFFAAMTFAAERERGDPALLLRWLAIGLAALAVLAAAKFVAPPAPAQVPGGRIEWASAMPGFINLRHLGSWSGAIAAGLMVQLLWSRERATARLAALYVLAAGMTVWTGTRAAVLAMAVVAVVALVTLRRLPERRAIGRVAALTALALAAGMALVPPGEPDFLLFAPSDAGSANSMTGGRLALWEATGRRWLAAPLLGWGSGSTFWEVDIGWSHTQPHNVVLQFLISWGVVGAAGGLWLVARGLMVLHRHGMRDDALRPLSATVYALVFMSLLEGMLHYPRFIAVIALGMAVVAARAPQPRSRASSAALRSSPQA